MEGDFEFVDAGGKTRRAQQRLVPFVTVLGGRAYGSINS